MESMNMAVDAVDDEMNLMNNIKKIMKNMK